MAATPPRTRFLVVGLIALLALSAVAWAEAEVPDGLTEPPLLAARGYLDPVDSRRAQVWAVGDGADGSAAAEAVAARIAEARPDRFLYLGDVYDSGTAAEYASNYAPAWGALAEITAPTLGNHEAANAASGYGPYWQSVLGRTPPSFYSFRVGGWQLLSLNSEIAHGRGSPQLRWLRERTQRDGDCRIAFWHRPRHSAGEHGSARDMRALWRALAGRARVAIGGHDHNLQRFAPRGGIVQLVAGAGGHDLTAVDRSHPGLRFADDAHDGALRLQLRGRSALLEFVSVDGEVLDSSTVRCRN